MGQDRPIYLLEMWGILLIFFRIRHPEYSLIIAVVLNFKILETTDTKPVSQFEKTLPAALISWRHRRFCEVIFFKIYSDR